MGRASDSERLVRCAAAARLAARGLEDWEAQQRWLLATIYEQARGGLPETVPKRVAARVLGVNVSTLDRWVARGAIESGGPPGSGRQEIGTDIVIELACELRLGRPEGRSGDAFRRALQAVWRQRLHAHEEHGDVNELALLASAEFAG
jgi:hypothetical protein